MNRICIDCGIEKDISYFPRKIKKSGKFYYKHRCKECQRIVNMNYNIKNNIRSWCTSTINNHKTKGFNINITIDELFIFVKDKKYCYICGKELDWSRNKGHITHNSPTLDRVYNENIININNIQILCRDCNTCKSNKDIIELLKWCKKVIEVYSG